MFEELNDEISQAQGELKCLDKDKALEQVTSVFAEEKTKRQNLIETLEQVKLIQEASCMIVPLTSRPGKGRR